MKNHIIANGVYDLDNNDYRLSLETEYSSNLRYERAAFYYPDTDTIDLVLFVDSLRDDVWYYAYFTIENDVSGAYLWHYFNCIDDEMGGTLYASNFKDSWLLSYSYNNIYNSSHRKSTQELASAAISYLCANIDNDFEDIRISAKDLGFNYY